MSGNALVVVVVGGVSHISWYTKQIFPKLDFTEVFEAERKRQLH